MTTTEHDNDLAAVAGACSCEMCVWADRQELEQRERQATATQPMPTPLQAAFNVEWTSAQSLPIAKTMTEFAEYFFRRGYAAHERLSHPDVKKVGLP